MREVQGMRQDGVETRKERNTTIPKVYPVGKRCACRVHSRETGCVGHTGDGSTANIFISIWVQDSVSHVCTRTYEHAQHMSHSGSLACLRPILHTIPYEQEPKKEPQSQKIARRAPKNFLNNSRARLNKTSVLRQIAPESSPESSAKSLSQKFFGVPFLSLI